ncbi:MULTISPECIES: hypothetical protein [unclassified Bradyrhizobium]|uniref:hypothetical protein n=1 Tax=unclassified Bradyrhizobium TaxID=2631580 RepID=UPI002FF373C2
MMSLSCGFATESTIPEMDVCGGVPGCMNFDHANMRVMVRICHLFEGAAVRQSKKLRSEALRLHLPSGSEAFLVLLALSGETR